MPAKIRKPRNYNPRFTKKLHDTIEKYEMSVPDGCTIFGTNNNTGCCTYNGVITVPSWTENWDGTDGRMVQYVAHEIAHAYTFEEISSWKHNSVFMKWMKRLCPEKYWFYELSYKPRAAKAAGITYQQGKQV